MGLDSVELVMAWEEGFGITIGDEEAGAIRTPRMATALICRKLGVLQHSETDCCLYQRGFYRLRHAFKTIFGVPRNAITPRVRLKDIVPSQNRHLLWSRLAAETGVPKLSGLPFDAFCILPRRTFGELALHLVARHPRSLLGAGAEWTQGQVREVVRAVVSNQLGIRRFADDADFITDLRID